MEQLRRALATISKQLGRLTPSQKLLIASLAVVAVMTLFLVAQYSGKQDTVAIIPDAKPEEQTRAKAALTAAGIKATLVDNKVHVPVESRIAAVTQLAQSKALPADTTLTFANLYDKQTWLMPRSQMEDMANTARQNVLTGMASGFPGVERATVMISNPEIKGLGQAVRKPTAQVTVFMHGGASLKQEGVDALADMVAYTISGLDPSNIAIIDATHSHRYKATPPGELAAGSYLEQVTRIEARVQEKIEASLRYIESVIVAVNVQVDSTRRETKTTSVLPKGQGSEAMVSSTHETTRTDSQQSSGGETGVRPNVGMDARLSGGDKTTNTDETSETRFATDFGRKEMHEVDANGRPTSINVSVGIPRDYMATLVKQQKGAAAPAPGGGPGGAGGGGGGGTAEPTDDEINKAWPAEQQRLEQLIRPLVESGGGGTGGVGGGGTRAGKPGDAGSQTDTLVVSLIPVPMPFPGGAGRGAGGADGGAAAGGLGGSILGSTGLIAAGGGLVKTVGLGALAVVALGMMLLMVRKAGRVEAMPSAEELVGIPPALATGNDLVGEAAEGDTAMAGIELDDESLHSKKMLEQIAELVRKNPKDAATIFNRWVTTEG